MINLSSLIGDKHFSVICTLRKTRIKRTADGRESHSFTDKEILAVIQPATPDELSALQDLSAGRLTETLSIYTRERLTVGYEDRLADTIFFNGRTYDVVQVSDYLSTGGYCQSLITRVSNYDDRQY
jgi:hypothetical protein